MSHKVSQFHISCHTLTVSQDNFLCLRALLLQFLSNPITPHIHHVSLHIILAVSHKVSHFHVSSHTFIVSQNNSLCLIKAVLLPFLLGHITSHIMSHYISYLLRLMRSRISLYHVTHSQFTMSHVSFLLYLRSHMHYFSGIIFTVSLVSCHVSHY